MAGRFCYSSDSRLEPISVEFADGRRDLPEHIIRAVGEAQLKDEAVLAQLKEIAWPDFLKTIEREINVKALNGSFSRDAMYEVDRKQVRGY